MADSPIVENIKASYNTITGQDDNQASLEARAKGKVQDTRQAAVTEERDQVVRRRKQPPPFLTQAPRDRQVAEGPAVPLRDLGDKVRV